MHALEQATEEVEGQASSGLRLFFFGAARRGGLGFRV